MFLKPSSIPIPTLSLPSELPGNGGAGFPGGLRELLEFFLHTHTSHCVPPLQPLLCENEKCEKMATNIHSDHKVAKKEPPQGYICLGGF